MSLQQKQYKNLIAQIEIEREITKYLCIKSFSHFVKTFWHVVEPGAPYVHGFHIDAICQHLEAVEQFKIQKLLINIPPRHTKSTLVSVMFPAWVWLRNPNRKFIYASYSESLAIRDSVKCRSLIESTEYQRMFQPTWSLSEDQNQKKFFENSAKGGRHAIGIGGSLTGLGGDHLFIDDPVNAVDAYSEAIREEANRWHDTAFSSRYNDPQRHSKVIIMQRLHEEDLTGHVLKKGDRWDRLILPARYEPDAEVKSKTTLGWVDPRAKKGALLWPERFNEKAIRDLEVDLDHDAEAQLQQNPQPRKGGLFPVECWQTFETSPSPILETVQFIDAAQKPGISNDYSVIATWVRTDNAFYCLDVYREQIDMPTLQAMTEAKADSFKPDAIVIEDKAGGSSLIQYLQRDTTLPVIPYEPTRDKEVRATAATPTVKAKKCHLPKGAPWVKDFVKEHRSFGKQSKHDDQVDTTSMMVAYFVKGRAEPNIRSF